MKERLFGRRKMHQLRRWAALQNHLYTYNSYTRIAAGVKTNGVFLFPEFARYAHRVFLFWAHTV